MANAQHAYEEDDEPTVALNVKLPAKLRKRAGKIAKRLRTSTTALIVAGLFKEVEAYESKQRVEEEQLRREKEEGRRTFERRMVSLADPASLAPSLAELAPVDEEPVADPSDDEDKTALADAIYREEAEKIFNVLADPIERRIAAHTAVKTIREQRPLTAPSDDHVILRRLDKLIVKLQTKRPAPPPPGPATSAAAGLPTQEEASASITERLDRLHETALAPDAPPPILSQFFNGLARKPNNK